MAISEKAEKFLGSSINRGRAIPGQSLTNSPEEPYNWERPPEFTEPRKAMYEVFDVLIEKCKLARTYFDDVVKKYFKDPTKFFIEFLQRHKL